MNNIQEIKNYIEEMRTIQEQILRYIWSENENEVGFEILSIFFQDNDITQNKYKFKAILHLIENISENHYRDSIFIEKIENIIKLFQEQMTQFFTNDEIFLIFQKNKRILLFLFQEEIIKPNSFIASVFLRDEFMIKNYPIYFFKEFDTFFNSEIKEKFNEVENSENFESKRKIGENDSYICELIRNDNINEFISFVNVKNISISSEVIPSIFETNSFLLKKNPKLIEYSAFCGSIQIFKYLLLSKADFTSSLWLYAIHSGNNELIHILEDNNIEPVNENYIECYEESIKCFNNELADYFYNNFLTDEINENPHFLKYYNFEYLPDSIFLFDLCKYDHFIPTQSYLKSIHFDLNNQEDKRVLVIAAKKGNLDIVQLLLECDGVDVNFKAEFDILKSRRKEIITALTAAVCNNYLEITKLLLKRKEINVNSLLVHRKHRIKVKKISKSALFLAVSNQNAEIVKLLLKNKKINVNYKSSLLYPHRRDEKTALVKAIETGNTEIVSLLLDHPCIDVNIRFYEDKSFRHSRSLKTALFIAVENGNIETIKLLLNRDDIDVNEMSIIELNDVKSKLTPLCLSVEKNDVEIVKLLSMHPEILINKKSKWTEKTTNKETIKTRKSPLQIAIENNNANIVDILLKCPNIDAHDISNIYSEKRSTERFIFFIIVVLSLILLLIYSGLNEDTYLGYFCQLGLCIMAIISFLSFFIQFQIIFFLTTFHIFFSYIILKYLIFNTVLF